MPRHRSSACASLSGLALCCTLTVAAVLAGCTSFSPDAGMSTVNGIVTPALGASVEKISSDTGVAKAQSLGLLRSPLSTEKAVRVALLNNKGLQAAYNELGIAEAVMVQASLPPSPRFALSGISTPVELDIEARLVADILALATLPARSEIATDRFRQAKLRTAEETLRVAAVVRRSYYRVVAARALVAALTDTVSAAESAAKIAKQLAETGAINKLDAAREDAFYSDVSIQLAKARQQAASEREQLIRGIGLWDNDQIVKLPQALPTLPKHPRNLTAVETEALQRRIDLQIARIEVEALGKSYGLTKATRFINLLEISGVSRTQRESGGAHGTGGGGDAEFQIPIFDFGETNLRKAGETYMAAVNRLAETAVNVRSQAREAYQAYRSSYDIAARYERDVLPLRKTISDETLLRYGAMQIDVFSLLTEAQHRVTANVAAIEAQRDFWLANTNLEAALLGGGMARDSRPMLNGTNQAESASGE
jgi:outer membrane protein TolC